MWPSIVAIVVVAVVIIAVLDVVEMSGTRVSTATGPGPMGTPESYSEALDAAVAPGAAATGGPWTVVVAEGDGLASGVIQSNVAAIVGSGCTFTPLPGSPGTLILPGTPSNATAGEVATWIFFAINASQEDVLLIESSDGSADALGLVTGSGCVGTFTDLGQIGTSGIIDSMALATSFDANGGLDFLADYPVVYQSFVILGASSSTYGYQVWDVAYSTCSFTATSGSGTELTGIYVASTGVVLSAPATQSLTC